MAAYGDMDARLAGNKYGLDSRDESFLVKEPTGILPGYPVFGYDNDETSAYLFHQDQDTVLFDADFVTTNQIDGTVNGVAISPVTFTTDHATTSGLLAAAILAIASVTSATITDAGTDRSFRIITKGAETVASFTVTLGATQAGSAVTSAVSAGNTYLGVARFEQKEDADSNIWAFNTEIPVMTQGRIDGVTGETVEANTVAYVRTDGTFGTSGVTTSGRFKSNETGAGIANVFVGGENG